MTTIATDDILAQLEALETQRKVLIEKYAQPIIKAVVRKMFDECPSITGCEWRQYTPYFNDGDPCEFTFYGLIVYSDLPDLPREAIYYDDNGYEVGSLAYWLRKYNKIPPNETDQVAIEQMEMMSFCNATTELEKFLEGHLELLKESFGDHCKVNCDRDTMQMIVEQYDHD
jgi:hypothetical protein